MRKIEKDQTLTRGHPYPIGPILGYKPQTPEGRKSLLKKHWLQLGEVSQKWNGKFLFCKAASHRPY